MEIKKGKVMKAPDKIFVPNRFRLVDGLRVRESDTDEEYIRKDIVDETIKTAEDHAYFAGQEKFREKLMEWIQEARVIPHENAITRDLAFQEIINKINSM